MFIDLIEIFNQRDANRIKKILTENDIFFQVLNEKSFEIGNVYVLGQNGIQVRVDEQDLASAKQILIDAGFHILSDQAEDQFDFMNKVQERLNTYKLTQGINPLLFLVASIFIIIVLSLLLYLKIVNNIDITASKDQSFCVTEIIYNNQSLEINSIPTGFYIESLYGCQEKITFYKNSSLKIPGLNSDYIYAESTFNGSEDSLFITESSILSEVFDGKYKIQCDIFGNVKLISNTTEIHFTHEEEIRFF